MSWVDAIGYVATALLIASLSLRSVVRVRSLSLGAALLFGVYGLITTAWPVVVAAAVVAALHVNHLSRELRTASDVAAVPIEPDAPFLRDFLQANAEDIAQSQPGYRPDGADTFVRLLTREGLPAGVLVGEPSGSELVVKLDYVTPAYRDSQAARWMFGPGASTFTDAGFTRLVAKAHTAVHHSYLELMDFRPEGDVYVLDLRRRQ